MSKLDAKAVIDCSSKNYGINPCEKPIVFGEKCISRKICLEKYIWWAFLNKTLFSNKPLIFRTFQFVNGSKKTL